jgi:hypothetical protein
MAQNGLLTGGEKSRCKLSWHDRKVYDRNGFSKRICNIGKAVNSPERSSSSIRQTLTRSRRRFHPTGQAVQPESRLASGPLVESPEQSHFVAKAVYRRSWSEHEATCCDEDCSRVYRYHAVNVRSTAILCTKPWTSPSGEGQKHRERKRSTAQ